MRSVTGKRTFLTIVAVICLASLTIPAFGTRTPIRPFAANHQKSVEVAFVRVVPPRPSSDEMGRTLAFADNNGALTDEFAYQPYGRLIAHSGTTATPFTWLGAFGVWDAGQGLYLTRHRAYDSNLMRFVQTDPIGLQGGFNFYAYANGNPLAFLDFLGLCADSYDNRAYWQQGQSVSQSYSTGEIRAWENSAQLDFTSTMTYGQMDAHSQVAQQLAEQNALNLWTALAGEGVAGISALLRGTVGVSETVVIGENMGRVEKYASQIWADTFQGTGMEANRLWIQEAKSAGKQVIDIGPDFTRRLERIGDGVRPDSPFYNMERMKTTGYENYLKVFERTGKYESRVP